MNSKLWERKTKKHEIQVVAGELKADDNWISTETWWATIT